MTRIVLDPTSEHAYEHALAIVEGHSTMEMWDELEKDYRWVLDEYVSGPDSDEAKTALASPAGEQPDARASGGERPSTGGAWLSGRTG